MFFMEPRRPKAKTQASILTSIGCLAPRKFVGYAVTRID